MTVAVKAGTWQLDQAASTVAIRNKHTWGLATAKGTFTSVSGQGEVQPDGSARGTVTLDAASLDTGNSRRDQHLRSADFFDVASHPEISMSVEEASLQADGTLQVSGQLTVRGVSRSHSIKARLTSAGDDAVELETEFVVNRADFGVAWNQLGMIKSPTTVIATLRFTRQ